MSFQIEIVTNAIDYATARRVSQEINRNSYFKIGHEGPGCLATILPRLKRKRVVKHFGVEPAHYLLSDDHDPDEKTLKTDPSRLEDFALAIETFHKAIGQPFSVFLAWIGEKPVEERSCSLTDFTLLVRENRIQNKVKYLIS